MTQAQEERWRIFREAMPTEWIGHIIHAELTQLRAEVEKLKGKWETSDQRCPQCGCGIVPLQDAERKAIAEAVVGLFRKNLSPDGNRYLPPTAGDVGSLYNAIIAGEFGK